jgi:hypothetical protein
MAVGLPLKTTYANGDVFSAQDVNDITGTINQNVNPFTAGKNGFLNSAMQVWQRGTSVAVPASTLAYTADRFIVSTPAACASTISRQLTSDTTNLPFIQYCTRVQRNSGQTGAGFLDFTQMFETLNSVRYAGQTVTLSFYARRGANYSATSNLLKVRVFTGTGTDQSVYAGYTGSAQPVDSSATLTTTWQRFTFTFAVGATATEISVALTNVTTGTAGAADFFEVTGMQLEVGSTATPFQTATGTIQGELAACQRYLPSIIGSTNTILGFGKNTSQTAVLYKFPVTARVAPTGITTTTVSTDFYIYNQSFSTGRPSAISFDFAGTDMAVLATTHTAGSPTIALGQPTMLGISSGSGYILFTGCEL